MKFHEIPQNQRINIIGYRHHLLPDSSYSYIPPLVFKVTPSTDEVTRTYVGDIELKNLMYSQLLYLREYATVIYRNGASGDTPNWFFYLKDCKDHVLRAACNDRAAGRKLFSTLEGNMRYSPTTNLTMAILSLLKTAYTPETRLAAVGDVGFYILHTVLADAGFKDHADIVRHTVLWKTYGQQWTKLFIQAHPDLPPGVYDSQGQEVKDGYVYLAQVLVNLVGLSKAAAARELDVSRLSVINWLQ